MGHSNLTYSWGSDYKCMCSDSNKAINVATEIAWNQLKSQLKLNFDHISWYHFDYILTKSPALSV